MKFEGPQFTKLLNSLYCFYDDFGNPKNIGLVPYLNAMNSFNEIREICFVNSSVIDLDLSKERIKKFKRDVKVLIDNFDLSATNKLHDCFCHLQEWF